MDNNHRQDGADQADADAALLAIVGASVDLRQDWPLEDEARLLEADAALQMVARVLFLVRLIRHASM